MAQSMRAISSSTVTRGASVLQQQLVREIDCLTRQLEHACAHKFLGTTEVYQQMIAARNKMLNNLPHTE